MSTPKTAGWRVGFAGTPEFAAQALIALHAAGFRMGPVLTQPDRPAGRGMKLQASPVKREALARQLPVIQPRSLKLDGRFPDDAAAARDALQAEPPDVMVVAAYGLILPRWVLHLPRLGCLNIHGSLLPRWRGAAPIQRALEAGDGQTGITIMQMDDGLDTGAMLLSEPVTIGPQDTSASLHDRLADCGARLVVQALRALQAGQLQRVAQPAEGVTYAHKIDKAEALVDWHAPSALIERRIRAFDPFPGAHTPLGDQTAKLWRARVANGAEASGVPGTVLSIGPDAVRIACGEGALDVLEWQLPGGRRLSTAQLLQTTAGRQLRPGQPLGASSAADPALNVH